MNKSLNIMITILFSLILATVMLPFSGFYLAAYIEDTFYEPLWASAVFDISLFLSFGCLVLTHSLSKKYWNFTLFKVIGYPYLLLVLLIVGWVSNNAWYEYDTFSGFVYPNYSVKQDTSSPNHFLFQGPMDLGAANLLTQTVLGAKGMDPNSEIVLELHSDGGSPQVGILMAEFIKQYDLNVEVMGHCASACTIAMMGSSKRYIHPRAWIGFHSAYLNSDLIDDRYDYESLKFYNDWLASRLIEVGADEVFVEKSMIEDSSGGFYPSFQELKDAGIVNLYQRTYKNSFEKPSYL